MSRILVLDIDDDKHDGFVEAIVKRAYIRVVSMEREARKQLSDCPCCGRRLSKELPFTVNDHIVEALVSIAGKMKIAKSVIIVNKDNLATTIPPVEMERCVEIDALTLFRLETLGLVCPFQDGSRETYFISATGLAFMSGEAPAKPCTVVTLDGEIIEMSGELTIEDVKYKDQIRGDTLKRLASRAVKALSDDVINFVTSGQISLI